MNDLLLEICFGLLAISILLVLYRLVRGPHTQDRILAFEAIAICVVGMVALLSLKWRSAFFIEIILITAALGFFGTMAFVFYLSRDTVGDGGAPEEDPGPEGDD